jgi:rhodanese-related sulfurtransferase
MQVAHYLEQVGFDVRNVAGGTVAWIRAGFALDQGTRR